MQGQERLLRARILIVGLGGLGSPVALYLAASGVGTLVLCDHDTVELSNLQRQIIHKTAGINRKKTDSAAETLQALNPEVKLVMLSSRLADDALRDEVGKADIVIDASDNFPTRYALNAACVELKTPLISGSAARWTGQVSTFRFDLRRGPCYHCLYPNRGRGEETCAQTGVFAPLVGVIGGIQAAEAIKILLNLQDDPHGRLLQFDARAMTWRASILKNDPYCPICMPQEGRASALEYRTVSR